MSHFTSLIPLALSSIIITSTLVVTKSYFTMAESTATSPLGPFKLVTVNTAPERARKLIGRVVDEVKDRYIIIHAANVESM